MIEVFSKKDLENFLPNEYSDPTDVLFAINGDNWLKWSLKENGSVQAIIMAAEYHNNCYSAFFLISKDFNKRNAAKLRDFVYNTRKELNMVRIQTDSLDDKTLNRWHEYFGFQFEGIRRKLMFGKDYISWAIVL